MSTGPSRDGTHGADRDERWLADIFDAHARDVRRYLRRRLQAAADAESDADDLTAEVFAITWRRRDDVAEPTLAWLYGVARRVLAAHRRRVVALAPPIDAEESDLAPTDDVADLVTEDLALRQAWSTLSDRDREILLLAAWEGLSESQIAVMLDVSVGGASSALSRARARLREALSDAHLDG